MLCFCKIDALVRLVLVVHVVLSVTEYYIRVDGIVAVGRGKQESRFSVQRLHVPAVCVIHYGTVVSSRDSRCIIYHICALFGIVDRLRRPCTVRIHHQRIFAGYLYERLVKPVDKVCGLGAYEIAVAVPAQR